MNFKPAFFEKKEEPSRILHDEQDAAHRLGKGMHKLMPVNIRNRPIVIVCIGTDRSTGDSLGPLVGTLLEEKDINSFYIYGTLDEPIHALNLEEKIKEIHQKHAYPFIIAIDACLGRLKSVGVIQFAEGPVKPGAGVNKELPAVGDMHITGIVNVSGFMEYFVLQNTRLNLVLKMAKTIANGISIASMLYHPKHDYSKLSWSINQEHTN